MSNTVATLAIPPVLTCALAFALHFLGGERAQRVALLPAAASLLLCWTFIVRPGWMPVDDARRVLHNAAGAALLGVALDLLRPHRLIAALLCAGFVLIAAAASVRGTLTLSGSIGLDQALMIAAATLAGFFTLARLDAMRERPISLLVLLTVLSAGLAGLAAIGKDELLTALAGVLGGALFGYLIFLAVVRAAASDGLILVAGTSILAIVWALGMRNPGMLPALVCLPLVLFAEATAQRVPLPNARISGLLYPLILAGVVGLPLVLAALIAFVTTVA